MLDINSKLYVQNNANNNANANSANNNNSF